MKLKALKPKLGHWLTIKELRTFFHDMHRDAYRGIPINRKLLEMASEFVEDRRGWWEHPDWESFLDRLDKEGFSLTEETKAPVGNILEIFKSYYHSGNFQTIKEKRQEAHNLEQSEIRKPGSIKGHGTEKHA